MEHCPGGELFDRLTNRSNLNEKEVCLLMYDVLKAISHCHSLNIAHRDIKPENLMYGQDGKIKLIDFGLAKKNAL